MKTTQDPMRPPFLGKWCYEGGIDTDAWRKHLRRPDSHHTIGRANAKRSKRKAQRRQWNKLASEPEA